VRTIDQARDIDQAQVYERGFGRQTRGLIWVGIAILFVIRGATLFVGWESFQGDPDAYRALAATWHDTGTFGRLTEEQFAKPTAYRPPLFPWLLSWVSTAKTGAADAWWIATLHLLFGCATCVLTLDIARRLELSTWVGWIAALLVACDPILLRQSTLVMTETTATFLSTFLWWLWLRDDTTIPRTSWSLHACAIGGWMGAAALCRPTAWAWIALWWMMALCMFRWRWVVVCGLGTVVAISPWVLRNEFQLGAPIVTTTHGGYTLYLANNPALYDHWRTSVSREWDEESFHSRWRREQADAPKNNEMSLDRLAQSRAWSTMANDPAMLFKGMVIRTGWLWALWPSQRQSSLMVRWMIGGWYATIMGLAVVGAWKVLVSAKGRLLWMPGLLLIVSLTMVHSVYWSNMRMRAPAVPAVSLLASLGLYAVWQSKIWSNSVGGIDGKLEIPPEKFG
jgi:hypothetical protein